MLIYEIYLRFTLRCVSAYAARLFTLLERCRFYSHLRHARAALRALFRLRHFAAPSYTPRCRQLSFRARCRRLISPEAPPLYFFEASRRFATCHFTLHTQHSNVAQRR